MCIREDGFAHVGQYAFTNDGRTIIIDTIVERRRKYRGRDVNLANIPEVEVERTEIIDILDEICRDVVVE